ncbi:29354_t:CDS:10 [Gigaspora margarita]|uniref:Dolichyl-phosphate-mannose--protein mannosyltransferase n=1 Tax=Gigaspora margarita TaxID=4874 RepID=A0ABN7UEM8_GIGMA|nr:29354_t:CDS:10 [Gigaspora margarita]
MDYKLNNEDYEVILNPVRYSTSIVSLGDIRYRKKRFKEPDSPSRHDLPEDDLLMYDTKENGGKSISKFFTGISTSDVYNLLGLIVVSIIVRLYRLDHPNSAVHYWFLRKYIRGNFFIDMHPPLAKLLIALPGYLSRYDGILDLENESEFSESKYPYVTMRLISGILGIFIIPFSYLTIKLSGFSTNAAFLVSALLIFENALVTQSRLILLDSPLMASTAFTMLIWVKFHNEQKRPFKTWWWIWLIMTGVGLGLTVSIKWVGFFTTIFIGLLTIKDLWDLLGDLHLPLIRWVNHFLARVLCLLVIPVILYMLVFAIHFSILENSGDDAISMSPEFRHTLNGHGMNDTPIDVGYGSTITLRHFNTRGGYLHSHNHHYPSGSKQQQVTLYPFKDENNLWIIQKETDPKIPFETINPSWIYHNTLIRLSHVLTEGWLHSHNIKPPVTNSDDQNEVSVYGSKDHSDTNDLWRVEIVDHEKSDSDSGRRLRAIHTKFRLFHINSGCYLYSHSNKLPEWGFKQQEVTCGKGATFINTIWHIETNSHPKLPSDTKMVNYKKLGFFEKFIELNQVMWTNFKSISLHPYLSHPSSWILLKRGIGFWAQEHYQIYLIGNPFIWWTSTLTVLIFVIEKLITILKAKRGSIDRFSVKGEHFKLWSNVFLMGWCLHYLPFYLMSKELFLQYYFPSLYFAILLIGIGFDLITERFNSRNRTIIVTIFLIASIYIFILFSPLTYGNTWEKSSCDNSKWLSSWDYDCDLYVGSHLTRNTNTTGIEITNQEFSDIRAFDKRAAEAEDEQDEQM